MSLLQRIPLMRYVASPWQLIKQGFSTGHYASFETLLWVQIKSFNGSSLSPTWTHLRVSKKPYLLPPRCNSPKGWHQTAVCCPAVRHSTSQLNFSKSRRLKRGASFVVVANKKNHRSDLQNSPILSVSQSFLTKSQVSATAATRSLKLVAKPTSSSKMVAQGHSS